MSVERLLRAVAPRFLTPLVDKLRASPLGRRFARGSFWSFAGAAMQRSLRLVSSIGVARFLAKAGFGEFGMVQGTVGLFRGFALFGLGKTTTKYVAELGHKDPDRAGRIIGLSIVISVVLGSLIAVTFIALAPWLAANTLAAPQLAGPLRIGAVLIFMGAINGVQTGTLSGMEAFKKIARIRLVAGVASVPLLIGGAYLAGLNGALWALVAFLALSLIMTHLAVRKETARAGIAVRYAGSLEEWRVLSSFSLPIIASGLTVVGAHWICRAILVNQPAGYAEMGTYSAAGRWGSLVLFVPSHLGLVAMPMLSSLYGQGKRDQYLRLLKYHFLVSGGVAAVFAVVIALFSGLLMRSYGPDFEAGRDVLVVVCVGLVLMQLSSVVGTVNQSIGAVWFGFGINLVWAAFFVGGMLLLRGRGAMGLALAALIAYSVSIMCGGAYLYYRFRYRWHPG